MAMEWTVEQSQTIGARRCNLVVSAAAGSGKTAVLVERICRLVVQDGADLERMVVATFTRAAAAEMKSRIAQRLSCAAAENPSDSARLNAQLQKIDHSAIGTLHSFCGDLLRQYFNVAGIEPTFRTEDDSVTRGLYDEALEETVDSFFEQGDGDFLALADCWGGRGGAGLASLASKVYDAARNYPDGIEWLRRCAGQFDFSDASATPWYGELTGKLTSCVALAAESLGQAMRIASRPGGPGSYLTRLEDEQQTLERLLQQLRGGDIAGFTMAFGDSAIFGRLPSRKKGDSEELAGQVKGLRDEAKKLIKKASANPIVCGMEQAAARTREMAPQMRALVRLVEAFDSRYTAEKRYANVLDYADLEHLALKVLADGDACGEIRDTYDAVFIDEYQDISPVQDELLRRISRPGTFFCVGDVKQSIYGFRSAEPELFVRRLQSAETRPDALERRIDLNRNFRSAPGVVALVNYLFGHLMSRQLGGVEYGPNERLAEGAPQPAQAVKQPVNELVLIDNGGMGEEELTRLEELVQIEREATVVAGCIRELLGSTVWDGKAGAFRPIRHSDIVVLLRTVSGVAADYAEVFRRAGIPVYAEAEGGFAEEPEVQLLANVLGLIDNSLRDYELITSMHSPFGRFSLEDLLEIRGLYRTGSFAGAVARYHQEVDSGLSDRIGAFLAMVDRWRALAGHSDLEKLVYRICDDTGYCGILGTWPDGERRQANVAAFAALGRNYPGGLYDFVRYFNRLAATVKSKPPGHASGAVSIMSVHKSKGLEYPVVILANVGKQINLKDAGESMLVHGELGLGPRYFNALRRTRAVTISWAALSERVRQDSLSEEMRMLYVAATRARERLIIVGTVANLAKRVAKWSLPLSAAGLSERAKSWADWLGPVALRTAQGSLALAPYGADQAEPAADDESPLCWKTSVLPAEGIQSLRPAPVDSAAALKRLTLASQAAVLSGETEAALLWQYPWGDVAALPSKVSATSLLDRSRNWRGPIPAPEIRRVPRFLEQGKRFSATDLGTFVHTALQLLPASPDPSGIPAGLLDLERRGLLPDDASAAIDAGWIERFHRSDIARRMGESARVLKELPFNLAVPARVVFPGETSGEEILVQGIIDCCFIEDGMWVLLDYKTNRVDGKTTAESIAAHYRPQLQTYRTALEEITGIPVKEAFLYLLSVGMQVKVAI